MFCIPVFDTIDVTICAGDSAALMAILPQGYRLPEEIKPSVAGHYMMQMNLLTEGGCDSIVWVDITVNGKSDTMVYVQASQQYEWNGTVLTKSDIYMKVLEGSNGCDSVVRLKLSLLDNAPIPVIYTFRNRVVMIDHNASGYNNVDYIYYRWYRNGEVVAEGPLEDSYQTPGKDLSGCFYLEVPTSYEMTEWVRSNTLCIGTADIDDLEQQIQVTMAPNPVKSGSKFSVYVDVEESMLNKAKLTIYNVHGVQVAETTAHRSNEIVANFPSGVYTVHLSFVNGLRWVRKIIVR